jgi:UDP-3-O-[3-hydroxymyristoyl] glucosamine N-acyltransferase
MSFTARQIAALLGGELYGNPDAAVSDVAPVESAQPHQLSFITDDKYLPFLATSHAGVVLVSKGLKVTDEGLQDRAIIFVENARGAMAQLLQLVAKAMNPARTGIEQPSFISEGVTVPEDAYIGAFAYIGRNVRLGKGVQIYPHVFIGDNAVIGDNTLIYAGTRIYHDCRIGADCILHAGVVIGSDGFGFEPDAEGVNRKIQQIGNVIIEDDVEIGANTTIDRAMMGSTVIRRNAKLDNLIQIGHNVEVGESTILCAQVGIAGSTKVGSHCILAGQVGVTGHIEIADHSVFAGKTGVTGNIRKAGTYSGIPAIDAANWRRSMVCVKQLPDIIKQLNKQEKK